MKNKYEIRDDGVIIYLDNGFKTTINKADLEKVSSIPNKWNVAFSKDGKPLVKANISTGGGKYSSYILPRFILFGTHKNSLFVAHKNGNSLDNRRENLTTDGKTTTIKKLEKPALEYSTFELSKLFLEKFKSHDVIKITTNEKGKIEFWIQSLSKLDDIERCSILAYDLEEIEHLTVDELIKRLKKDFPNAPTKALYERRYTPETNVPNIERLWTYYAAGFGYYETAHHTKLNRALVKSIFEQFKSQEHKDVVSINVNKFS
ncbi:MULTISPECIES: hypothetical protein [Heyndrickxia]|uniref:hypothetical protein n=1 Tax=Heyndrickxia TaxID=2837504 RepID=UPI002DBAA111|nr:hypothetical protein [Weizmannia sp. CD-2023]MEC2225014.1 hypothetical protein [Weizmannia sp. CD-2023]